MKKIVGLLLLMIAMSVGVSPNGGHRADAASNSIVLKDISKSWAKAEIQKAVEKGYVKGYLDGTFRPNNNVTRSEFIKMLVDALGYEHTDVPGSWYRGYVNTAITMNLHVESDFKDYTANITRLEIMRLTARALATTNAEYDNYLEEFSSLYVGDIPFTDYRSLKMQDILLTALTMGTGIVTGFTDHSAGFSKMATRAEAVVMIERMLAAKEKNPNTFQYLNEMKEIAETGTNVTTFNSNVEVIKNLNKDDVVINHAYFSAKVKRLYFIPFEGNSSFYEPKFVWDRNVIEDFIRLDKLKGYFVAVLDITVKANNFQDSTFGYNIQLTDLASFSYQKPRISYSYDTAYMDTPKFYKNGSVFEAVLYGKYTDQYIDTGVQTLNSFVQILKKKP